MAQNVQPPFRKRNGTKCTTTIQEKEWHVQPPFRKRNGTKCTTTIQEKEWRFEWCHFKPLCTKKRPRHMALEILVLAWDRHNNLSGLNWLMRSQPSSPDNWYLTSILFFFLNLVIYIHVDIIQF